jgi:hypothetical protein
MTKDFTRKFIEEMCIPAEQVIILQYGLDYEYIIFGLTNDMKVEMEAAFKATVWSKKAGNFIKTNGTKISAGMTGVREYVAPELAKATGKIAVEAGLIVAETTSTIVKEAKFTIGNYYAQKREERAVDPRQARFTAQRKQATNDLKMACTAFVGKFKAAKEDDYLE